MQTTLADDYSSARAELIDAYQAEDFRAMQYAAQKALVARPEYPAALYNLAFAYTLNERPRDALRILNRLVEKGIDFGVVEAEGFAALREEDDWNDYVAAIDAINQPVGSTAVAGAWPDGAFIPEGIAVNAEGDLLLGSIRNGSILELGAEPRVIADGSDNWSAFGMRFHPDGALWFASSAVPQLTTAGEDSGQAGLFRLEIESGTITKAAILPPYEEDQVLGDLVIADANTIYTTDSRTGAVYRYYIDSNEYEVLVPRGKLGSPQGLVLDAAGLYLYVADYTGGLYRVSTLDGSLLRLEVPRELSDFGIDGLYRYGDELVAIQNGIQPHRVTAFALGDGGISIEGMRVLASNQPDFDEPTLGFVNGDEFFFVANSHWNRFDDQNQLPDGLAGPVVLKLSLAP